MEVVPASGGGAVQLPFQRRNVQEWSRLDRLTGMLEHARVETDQWAANTASSTRKYGKVVDSRARKLADGSVQQQQRKQLEVFQAQVPGGSLQVIRSQSVTSTSTSSSSTSGNRRGAASAPPHNFDNLQLSVNPLDYGPQKNKASVGRSGSIGSRRPPSRPRSIISKVDNAISEEDTVPDGLNNENTHNIDSRLSQVSRICQHIHEEAKRKAFGNTSSLFGTSGGPFHDELEIEVTTPRIQRIQDSSTEDEDASGVQIEEISDDQSSNVSVENSSRNKHLLLNGSVHKSVARKKSSSTEDLHNSIFEVKEKKEEGSGQDLDWKRTSHIRRSLQFPLKVSQDTSTVSSQRSGPIKLLQELEDGRVREGNALKGYEALKSVFRRGANIADSVNKSMTYDKDDSENLLTDSLANHLRNENMNRQIQNSFGGEGFSRRAPSNNNASPSKRHSFVTVESLKEVRGRLRRLSSPPLDDTPQNEVLKGISNDVEENDDGIVTEDTVKPTESDENIEVTVPTSRVRSYVFGMEALSNVGRKPVAGTGSLESRTSSKSSGSGGSRSEEWYNRRKSYGFEQVHSHESDDQSKSIKFREKNKVESSTDSGICRSSEAVTAPVWSRTASSKVEEIDIPKKQIMSDHPRVNENVLKISHSIQIKKTQDECGDRRRNISDTNEGRSDETGLQKGRRTVVTLGNEFSTRNLGFKACDDNTIIVHSSIMKEDSLVANGFRVGAENEPGPRQLSSSTTNRDRDARRLSEPVTITIPIVSEDQEDSNSVESKRLFFRQLSEGTSLSIESSPDKALLLNGSFKKDNTSSVSLSRSNSQAAFKRGTWNGGDDWTNTSKILDNEMKRHSIAVDESKYVREGLRSYSLHNESNRNHFDKEFANVSTSELVKRFAALNSMKQEDSSFSNKENGTVSTPSGINISFIQNGEVLLNHDESTDDLHLNGKKQKKVEFCKTEVHFAAESGRVNIVETDVKPPPSNMFRRRRRPTNANVVSSPVADPSKNNLPEVRFGDSPYEKKLLGGNEITDNVKAVPIEGASKVSTPTVIAKPEMSRTMVMTMSKFQDDADKEDQTYTQANATIVAALHHETSLARSYEEDLQGCIDHQVEQQNNVSIAQNELLPRSILKNNRKPRPFLLGESNNMALEPAEKPDEEQEDKWGIRLRPVQSQKEQAAGAMWRSTVTLRSTAFESPQQQLQQQQVGLKEENEFDNSSVRETELQKLLRSLRPSTQRSSGSDTVTSGGPKSPKYSPISCKKNNADNDKNGVQVKISTTTPEAWHSSLWSVADRIRQVEDLKQSSMETKGYSTKINFGAGEATIVESGSSDDQQGSSHKQLGSSSSSSSSLFQQSDRPKPIWLRREERKQDSVMVHGHPNSEAITDEPHQLSVATAVLPSYDNNRLRTVETLVSTRSGQPKITSISLRYEGDQDMDTTFDDVSRQKDGTGYSERKEKHSYSDTREEGPRLQSQRNHSSEHVAASFTYAPQGHSSAVEGKGSFLQDKGHSDSYLKDNEAHFHQRTEEKSSRLSSSSTYQKVKQSSNSSRDRLYKDGEHVSARTRHDLEKDTTYKTERQNLNAEKERLYLEEKYFSSSRDKNSHTGRRRSKSPAGDTLPHSDRTRSSYSPSKKSSSPLTAAIHYHDSDKERTPSPSVKSQHNVASTYFGHSSDNIHTVNNASDPSKFNSVYRQDGQIKSESCKQSPVSKHLKDDRDACKRSSSQSRKDIKESTIPSDSEEISVRAPQRTKVGSRQQEHGRHSYDMDVKSSRSRSESRGRSQSPSKTPITSEAVKSRNIVDHKVKRDDCESPIYENRDAFPQDSTVKVLRRGRTEVGETESTILEELTRAADQILQAVNGYTDDESNRASSDDDENGGRHRRGRRTVQVKRSSASLGTISETPSPRKQKEVTGGEKPSSDVHKAGGNVRRTQRLSKTRVGQNSSTSSVESFTREVRRSSAALLKKERTSGVEDRTKRKLTHSSTNAATKPGSRTARLLQRASSREMLLQTHASSSEDVMSGAEGENSRKPRVPRRSRTHNTNMTKTTSLTSIASSTKKASSPSPSLQHTSSPTATRLRKKDVAEVPKIKERHSASVSKQRSSTGEQPRSHSTRARDAHKAPLEEENHRRSSRRDGAEPKLRAGREGMEKMAGSSFTPLTTGRDKVDRHTSDRRLVGNINSTAVARSSTSHVVAKRKPSSSRSEGVSQTKSSK